MALSLQDMAKTPKKLQKLAEKKKPAKTTPDQIPQRSVLERLVRGVRLPLQAIGKAATFGIGGSGGLIERKLSGLMGTDINPAITPETGLEKGLSIGGEIVGSAAPIGGIYKLARPAVAKAITSTGIPGRIARTALPGSAAVGTYEGARSAAEGNPAGQVAKDTLMGAAVGGVGDVAGRALLKGISKLAKIPKNTRAEKEAFGAGMDVGEKLDGKKPAPSAAVPENTADSFRAKINRTPEKKSKFKDFAENFRTQFVDDLAPLEKLEKGVRGKIASAEDSLYKTARLFRGVPTKANQYVKDRLVPVIDNVEKSGYNYSDLGDYALAVHARDVNASGLKSGFTDNEIKAVLDKFGTPEMEAARQQLVKVSTELLDDLAASGVIEAELPQILRAKWPNYMPLFRHFDDDKIEFAGGLSKTLANVTSPIKKLKGSERDVVDPVESMVKNIFKSINASERNRVVAQLGRLADEDTAGQFVRRLAPGEERGRLNTVYERVNGEKVHYEVQPDVYKAIMDLDGESASFLVKMLQKPASVLRAGATLTPEFSFRNPMRDVVQAYVVSKSGFNPVIDFPRALFDVVLKKDVYKQWLRDSGGYGNIVSMDRNVHREVLNKIIKEPAGQKFVNVISGKSLIGVLRAIADASESATKLGEYKAAIRSGASKPEAAYRSRDIMDFARAGVSVRQANRIVAFLNANIQGKSKLLRAIREDPVKVTVRALKAVTLPSIGAYMAQKYMANDVQQQTIQDAPTWLKDTFWLIPVPGTNQVARIPKPFDLAPVFANLPERVIQYAAEKDPKAFDDFASQTLTQFSIPVMLTGLAPFVEGMANYSFFRQGPIIPERERDLNFPDQYDIRTSEVAKGIAKGVNTITGGEGALKNFGSPRVIDNTIRGLTAGLGTYATSAIDTLLEATGAVSKPAKPSKKISELPLLKAFLVNEGASGKSMSDLYDTREKLTREKGSAKANRQPFKEGGKLKYTQQVTKQIGDITKAIRQIENNPNMSPQEKRSRIEDLNRRRNELARAAASKL